MNYSDLNKLAPIAFLHPHLFKTELDNDERGKTQYEKGKNIEYDYILITYGGTWSAGDFDSHRYCTSYEGIGYHSNTADLLRGFLASGKPVYVMRWVEDKDSPNLKVLINGDSLPFELYLKAYNYLSEL